MKYKLADGRGKGRSGTMGGGPMASLRDTQNQQAGMWRGESAGRQHGLSDI